MTTRLAVAGVLVLGSPQSSLAQLTPISGELIVNTHTTGLQLSPSVCTVDRSESGVVARRLGGVPPSGAADFPVDAGGERYRAACGPD